MNQKITIEEQLNEIRRAVEVAIEQSAELSGLRNWFIWNVFKNMKPGDRPNDEHIVHGVARSLVAAFGAIIDSDDREFFESKFYTECDTEKGINRLHDLIYESNRID